MARKSEEKNAKLLAAYQMVGLDEDFSRAIVEGGNAKHIVETWKAPWRDGKAAEHPAIRAVLTGNATPGEAKSLLEATETHRDLVEAVASGSKTMTWAHTVLSAGFNGQKEAVSALLNGADPDIIADVLDIPLQKDHSKIIKKGGPRRVSSQKKTILDAVAIRKFSKHECVSILAKWGVKHTGSEELLRDRLTRLRILLEAIVQGVMSNSFDVNCLSLSDTTYAMRHGWRNRHITTFVEIKSLNGSSRHYARRVKIKSVLNKTTLNSAATALKIKTPSKQTKEELLKQIMDRGLFFGIIDEDQYEDYFEGSSNFIKG
jgi:hypothetical protein